MRFTLAILALALATFTRSGYSAEPQLAGGIKVVVHDSLVTYRQVEDATAPLVPDLRRQFSGDPQGFQKRLMEILDENTEALVQRELILHEFESAGYNLPESVIDDFVQQRIKNDFGDRATLARTLQARGTTFERFRQQLREQFIVTQMRMKHVSEATMISPHKIEVYYLANTNDFKVEEQVKLRMIILNKGSFESGQARKLAEEIQVKLNEGASFAEMASLYSQDSRRTQGGAWDWVERSVLRKDLADAAFSLKTGQRSDIIETDDACYLMLVEDRRPAHIRPLNEVRDTIEKTLIAQQRDQAQQRWHDRLKQKTFVRYFQ